MKFYLFRELKIMIILFLPVILLIVLWDQMPMKIPVQWSIDGSPLYYQPKYLIPFINIGLYYLFLIKTIITTDESSFDLSNYNYYRLRYSLFIFLSSLNSIFLMLGAGYELNSLQIILIFLFFIVLLGSEFMRNLKPYFTFRALPPGH